LALKGPFNSVSFFHGDADRDRRPANGPFRADESQTPNVPGLRPGLTESALQAEIQEFIPIAPASCLKRKGGAEISRILQFATREFSDNRLAFIQIAKSTYLEKLGTLELLKCFDRQDRLEKEDER
jgi:hypothetical protein